MPGLGQITTFPKREIKAHQVITFNLSRPIKWGEIEIYSVGGYLIRKYLLGELPAGDHAFTWDGRNERGEKVGVGVYIYVLTIEGKEQYSAKVPHAPEAGYGCVENLILQGWDLPQATKQCGFYEEVPEEVRGSTQMMSCIEEFIRRTPGLSFNDALKDCIVAEQVIKTIIPSVTPTPVTPTLEELELLRRLEELEPEKPFAMPGWAWMLIAAGALFLLTRK